MIDTNTLVDGYWKKNDLSVAERVKQNWAALKKDAADLPTRSTAVLCTPSTPRAAGLHPDGPPPKPKKMRVNDLDLNLAGRFARIDKGMSELVSAT